MTPEQIKARYVALANALAPLTAEAAALEEAMSEAKLYPLRLGVYNHIRFARHAIEDLLAAHE